MNPFKNENFLKQSVIAILLLLFCSVVKSQEHFVGSSLYYGNSNWIRTDNESYYNYNNLEYGGSFFWQRSILKKDKSNSAFLWKAKMNLISSHYTFLYSNTDQNIFRVEFLLGSKAYFLTSEKFKPFTELLVGGMIQKGYKERLQKGFSFTEELNFGADYYIKPHLFWGLSLGWKHVSNLNFYSLNKGLDIITLQTGIGIKIRSN